MLVTGSGITAFEIRTETDYKIDSKIALDWFQCEDGNHYATDWGADSDVYQTSITTYGTESYINNIIQQINNNRVNGDYILYLSDLADNEQIFGDDVDHTLISGVVTNMKVREAISWKGYKLDIDLRALSPAFKSLPSFSWSAPGCIQFEHRTDRDWDINKYDTYNSVLYIYDHLADGGLCNIKVSLSNTEFGSLRQFYRINRGNTFSLPSGALGLSYPFGPRSVAGPHNVKLIDLKLESRISPVRVIANLTLSEVIS